jgi:hypothetical protein
LKYLAVAKNIINEIKAVGIMFNRIFGSIEGLDANFTISTVGM